MSRVANGDQIVQMLNSFLDQVDQSRTTPGELCTPVLKERGKSITIKLPDDATFCDEPPECPRSGRYCFPSGNFVPGSSLGWPLKQTKNEWTERGRRLVTLLCKTCNGVVVAEIGSYLTLVSVLRMEDGSEHMKH